MVTITQQFGQRVRKLRTEKRMSQLQLSQESGLDLTTINEIENGNREPMLRTISRIAKAFNITISEIFNF